MPRRLHQNVTRAGVGTVNTAGEAVVELNAPGDLNFLVTQVSIEMFTAPAGATCVMRKNQSFVTFLVETGDAAGGDPPLMLRPGDTLSVEWSGCTPLDQGKVLWIYDEVGFE